MARPTIGDPGRAVAAAGEQAAEQRAEQDGDEGAGLDQRVAADQFLALQVLRQDRVLDRAEQRRVQAEQEQPERTARRGCAARSRRRRSARWRFRAA
jgi:hypothetical protein